MVAVHGVNATGAAFASLAAELGPRLVGVIAPDLRGRGGSFGEPPPWGIAAHADDVASLIEQVTAGPVTVVGHSMGAHVAVVMATARPDLVVRLVLVDGGPPRLVPPGTSADAVVEGALANIIPNLAADIDPGAVRADFADMVTNPAASLGPNLLPLCPVHLVRASLGVVPVAPPVVPDQVVEPLRSSVMSFSDEIVEGATHFSLLDPPWVARVAAALP